MSKDDFIEVSGKVIEVLPHGPFRVHLETGQNITAHISGKMKKRPLWLVPGDVVTVEISAYDLTRGIIVNRLRHEAA